jgi:dTMP kinase
MRVERDRIEKEGNDFQQRVRDQYLKLSEKDSDRVVVINGDKSIDEIKADIWTHMKEKFKI